MLAVAGIEPGTTGWAARTLPLRYIVLLLSLELASGTFLIPDLLARVVAKVQLSLSKVESNLFT